MHTKILPPQTYLRQRFNYDPITGALTWRDGKRAGSKCRSGFDVGLDGGRYLAQRIIWKWMTGNDPGHELDHVNCDNTDNRWNNLREATRTQNNWNTRKRRRQNPAHEGLPKGAFPITGRPGRFYSVIHVSGKRRYLGVFDTAEAANIAYVQAAKELHGSFMNAKVLHDAT